MERKVQQASVQQDLFVCATYTIPAFRRLTRDCQNRRLTRDSRIPDFSRKKFRKNRKNNFFGFPGPKSFFEIFMIFLYDRYFLYKPSFPSSQASKTLKIESARSKSTGGLIHSPIGPPGANFSPGQPPGFPFFDQCFLDFSILALLKSCFDKLDR